MAAVLHKPVHGRSIQGQYLANGALHINEGHGKMAHASSQCDSLSPSLAPTIGFESNYSRVLASPYRSDLLALTSSTRIVSEPPSVTDVELSSGAQI